MGNRKNILKSTEKFLYKNEEFKNILIDGEKTTYYISSFGYVINTNYRMTGKCNRLKDRVDENGYHTVYLYKNNERFAYKIHRLVAEAFIPNLENKPEVNHIDGDKSNNNVSNLEWATRTENMRHAVYRGLHRALKNEDHPESVYTNKQIHEVCKLIATGNILRQKYQKKPELTDQRLFLLHTRKRILIFLICMILHHFIHMTTDQDIQNGIGYITKISTMKFVENL